MNNIFIKEITFWSLLDDLHRNIRIYMEHDVVHEELINQIVYLYELESHSRNYFHRDHSACFFVSMDEALRGLLYDFIDMYDPESRELFEIVVRPLSEAQCIYGEGTSTHWTDVYITDYLIKTNEITVLMTEEFKWGYTISGRLSSHLRSLFSK